MLVGVTVSVSTLTVHQECEMKQGKRDTLGPDKFPLSVLVAHQHKDLHAHLFINLLSELLGNIDKIFVCLP